MKKVIKVLKNIKLYIQEMYTKYITNIRITIKKFVCRVLKIQISIIPLREEDILALEKRAGILKFRYETGKTTLEDFTYNEGMKRFSNILRSEYVK